MGPLQSMWWSMGAHTYPPPVPGLQVPMPSRYRSSTRVNDYIYPLAILIGFLLWQR